MITTSKKAPGRSQFRMLAIVVGVVGAGYFGWASLRTGDPPIITIEPKAAAVGQSTQVTVVVQEAKRGLVDVKVEALGAGIMGQRTLLETRWEAPPAHKPWVAPEEKEGSFVVVVGKKHITELTEGTLTLRVTAGRAGTWLLHPDPVVVEKTLEVKLTPPIVVPQSQFVHVAQGGVEAIVYQVGPTSVKDGVVIGDWTFFGHPLPGGTAQQRFALFALPYDHAGPEDQVKSDVKLFAEDDIGNRSTASFVNKYIPRPMGKDIIELQPKFMEKVTNEIYAQTPALKKSGVLLDDYLQLNRELRKQNNAFLIELSKKSRPSFLWKAVFQPFDNAAIKGAFADRRTYRAEGNDVDTQDHLGFDLARVERSPVPAGNDGVVAFAGYFGIYGNCVILDHGYGLMSLYAHLSSMAVKEGDAVTRGQTIATTGATGLAGGDHLHFTTLLSGLAVNPIEWWDSHWLDDRLKLKLGPALPYPG